jgi:sugar phosphate isomerase/epimerase
MRLDRVALLAVAAFAPTVVAEGLSNPFFVTDNGLGSGAVSLETRAGIAKQIGFDGIQFDGAKDISERLKVLDARGLKLLCLYVPGRIDGEKPSYDPGAAEAFRQLKGRDTVVWLTIAGQAPNAEERAVQLVREVADLAAGAGLRVAVYPHYGMFVARVEDALRLVEEAGRTNVGIVFNLCHWLRSGDERNMVLRLQQAMPHLLVVTINGADHEGGWDRLIQTLDRGSFDVFGFLKALVSMGSGGSRPC